MLLLKQHSYSQSSWRSLRYCNLHYWWEFPFEFLIFFNFHIYYLAPVHMHWYFAFITAVRKWLWTGTMRVFTRKAWIDTTLRNSRIDFLRKYSWLSRVSISSQYISLICILSRPIGTHYAQKLTLANNSTEIHSEKCKKFPVHRLSNSNSLPCECQYILMFQYYLNNIAQS